MSQTTKSALLERDAEHLIHPVHSGAATAAGHVWVRGEGARLFDADGRDYVDALSGLWNVFIGHGRPELADAAAAQMRQLAYASGYAGSSNAQAIALAETLAELAYPSINRFFLTSGGGESTDSSIKTARYFWKVRGKPEKTKVISRIWGYHGVTLAAMCATGMSVYWPMFEPRMPGFRHISSPYPYFYDPPPGKTRGEAAADELETAILEEGPDTVAMFIAEPVQGAGGVIVPTDDYFPRIREICDRYDVLLVSDEVITGFGRTGTMFGLNHWGIEPDIMQFAKAITSGHIPLGGIGLSDRVAATLDEGDPIWMHAYTYSAHPVSCAVALEKPPHHPRGGTRGDGGGEGGRAHSQPGTGLRRPPERRRGARQGPDGRRRGGGGPGDAGTLPGVGEGGAAPSEGDRRARGLQPPPRRRVRLRSAGLFDVRRPRPDRRRGRGRPRRGARVGDGVTPPAWNAGFSRHAPAHRSSVVWRNGLERRPPVGTRAGGPQSA